MMRAFLFLLALWSPVAGLAAGNPRQVLHVICYHDVRDDLRRSLEISPEPTAISLDALVQQFTWLQDNGYRVVSLEEVLAARSGAQPLPDKAVLLTFDDGLRSLYTRVFPLLQLFGYPAVAAVVTTWVGSDGHVTWEELREMQRTGLVEVASHSANLHHALPANSWGTETAAATTRRFDAARGEFEAEAAYRGRLVADLGESRHALATKLGRAPRALAWPYGKYNSAGLQAARAADMPIAFTLEPGANSADVPLDRLRRTVVMWNHDLGDFARALRTTPEATVNRGEPQRIMPVHFDQIDHPSREQAGRNVDRLVNRIAELRPSAVVVRGVDTRRAELFGRVAASIWRRLGVQVYVALPAGGDVATFERVARAAPELQGVLLEGLQQLDGEARATIDAGVAAMRLEHPALIVALALPATATEAMLEEATQSVAYVFVDATSQGAPRVAPGAREKLVFQVSSREPSAMLRAVDRLQAQGARHFAYDRDDLERALPRVADLRRRFSVQSELDVR